MEAVKRQGCARECASKVAVLGCSSQILGIKGRIASDSAAKTAKLAADTANSRPAKSSIIICGILGARSGAKVL
eukprot:1835031-Heterocapsa_arctica.AAC.1